MKRTMKIISLVMMALLCSATGWAAIYIATPGLWQEPSTPSDGSWDNLFTWRVWVPDPEDPDTGESVLATVLPGPADVVQLKATQSYAGQRVQVNAGTSAVVDAMFMAWDLEIENGLRIYGSLDLTGTGGGYNGLYYGAWGVVHPGGSLIQVRGDAVFNIGPVTVNNTDTAAVNRIIQEVGDADSGNSSVTIGNITIKPSLFEYQLETGTLTITASSVSGLSTAANQMYLNIAGGTLVIPSDRLNDILDERWARRIYAFDVPIYVHAGEFYNRDRFLEETDLGGGYVAVRGLHETKAANPIPADLSQADWNTDSLSWSIAANDSSTVGGLRTWTYNVYLNTDPDLSGVTPAVVGPIAADTKRGSAAIAPLTVGTTYYWRVDAIEPNGVAPYTPTVYTGDVWMFDAASIPTLVAPADTYDPGVDIDVNLEWSSENIVAASKIIITPAGESPVDLGVQTSPFNPFANVGIAMEWNKHYTWQVIELDAGSNVIGEGPAWRFKVRELECSLFADIDGSGDCIVNLADFAVLAYQWLECGWDDGGLKSPCP